MKNTLSPLEPPFTQEVAETLAQYPQTDGYILQLFRVFANSVRFLKHKGVSNFLDEDSPLTLREREITILRVCANTDCEYEWGIHVAIFASAAQLSQEQIKATRDKVPAECWSNKETTLLNAIDQLCLASKINSETYQQLQSYYSQAEQLEIMALCSNYLLVSFVANTTELPLESFSQRFDTESKR